MIAAAANFYNPFGLIPKQVPKLVFYLVILLLLFTGNRKISLRSIKGFPRKSYLLILFGMIGALIMAATFQEQSFAVSAMAILPYFFGYLSFLSLVRSGVETDVIKKIILGMLCCSVIIYIVNYVSFPLMPFGDKDADSIDASRGVIRIGVLYTELFILAVFYSINQWLISKKKKWLVAIAACGLMILLSVTRQVIAITVLFGALFIMKRARVYQKILFVAFALVFAIYVLPEIPIYKALVETTQNQMNREDNKEDPRIRASRFYLYEYQTNDLTRILGNGIPSIGNSRWGDKFETITRSEGCYSSDLGWIGFYWHFGAIASIGVLFVLFNAARLRKEPENEYLTYFFYAIILLSVLSAPILIYKQVISIMLVLYLTYKPDNKRHTAYITTV